MICGRFRALPPGLLTLGIVAAMLVGIIGLELRKGALDEAPAPAELTGGQQPEAPPASSPGNVPNDQDARHMAIILARPLFSPNRRPTDIAVKDTTKDLA